MQIHPKQIGAGGASSGNYMRFNGTLWVPSALLPADIITGLSTAASSIAVNSQKITGLGTPTASTDAATKGYADQKSFGFETDSTGLLSDRTKLFAYFPLDHTFVTSDGYMQLDRMGRVALKAAGSNSAAAPSTGVDGECMAPLTSVTLQNESSSAWFGSGTACFSAWFYCTTLPTAGAQQNIMSRVANANGYGWNLIIYESGGSVYAAMAYNDASGSATATTTNTVSVNTWYHVCGMITPGGAAGTQVCWLNGVDGSKGTATPKAAPIYETSPEFYIGRQNNGSPFDRPFVGRIAECAIWRGLTMTATHATELYNSGTPNRLRGR